MSEPAESLYAAIENADLPHVFREYQFARATMGRKWAFDFAWPGDHIACEVDGGSWIGGRHTSGSGFEKDLEKHNAATELGWRVFRFTPKMVKDGTAIATLGRLLGMKTIRDPYLDSLVEMVHDPVR